MMKQTFFVFVFCMLCQLTAIGRSAARSVAGMDQDGRERYVELLRNHVNVRRFPVTGDPYFKGKQGMIFRHLETSDGWHKVRFNVDQTGYISADTDLTAVVLFSEIPDSAICAVEHGAYFEEPDRQYSVAMQVRDGKVYVAKTICHVTPGTGSMRYYLTEAYLGTVSENMIICTKRWVFQFEGKNLDEMTESDFTEDIPPYVIIYSPLRKVFYMEGHELLQ